jgi:thiamine biosynthesis lipoprotein
MGTTWSVTLAVADLDPEAAREARSVIESELARVNGSMSTWDPDSELSRFNRHASLEPFGVSPPTLEVFTVARAVGERSGGAFDVTVGPLVAAWGFGAGGDLPNPPSEARLRELRARVGVALVAIDPAEGTLRKSQPQVACDLSGVAKGYAVDRVASALEALGYGDFLVEIGGELRARGSPLDGPDWRVAIEVPDPVAHRAQRVIPLREQALATSGDYADFYERDGVWISHLIDPRSGRPIAHGLASVSVLHAEAVWADAWATALIVLGPDEGWDVAQREGLAAHFIERVDAHGYRSRATAAFEALTRPQ